MHVADLNGLRTLYIKVYKLPRLPVYNFCVVVFLIDFGNKKCQAFMPDIFCYLA
jgi:hypothetical protein